ncbi:glycosyltransferase family 39 protein [Planosporangium sp. 12N6]|uniref:glycosyltransferase family 39 protein n=1 Tax=Planosporangium spinosum TaxID=3402278 RepID=UPI003CEA1B50
MAGSTASRTESVEPAVPVAVAGDEPPPFAWRPVAVLAAGIAALLAATSGRYDYHRDELYFRQLGRHLAWGYVDQPPLTPLLARIATAVLGDSVWALRVPCLLSVVATVFVVALIARELGGGRTAQVLAAAGVLSVFPLISGHVLLTSTVDLVIWSVLILFVIRALHRDAPRWWLAAGTVVGVGLYNKHLVVLLLLGLAGGLLLAGPRRVLRSGWLWAGVALALVIGAPNLVYQATHDWPQLAMAEALRRNKGDEARITLVPFQLILLGPLLVPVWVAGLVSLLRNPALRAVRALGVAYPLMCVLLFALAGQPYYTVGLLLALYAVGSVATARWLAAGGPRRWVGTVAVVGANAVLSAVMAIPVLPLPVLAQTPIPAANQTVADQIGWPAYVRQVADVHRMLPPDERAGAVIVTGNYGEAGALDRYGRGYGLPRAYSGQNELYRQGPPPESARTVVVVGGFSDAYLAARFASCVVAGRLDNGVGVDNEEQGLPVRICRDPRGSWRELWPRFQHFD